MSTSFLDKVRAFDKNGTIKIEIDNAMNVLRDFRKKYPFVENHQLIDTLNPEDVFTEQPSFELGDFFHYIEYRLESIGRLALHGADVYRQIRDNLDDFKSLLYIVVDRKKSLAEKVDAPWSKIKRLGSDKHMAKKIIFCFNFETGNVLPIFKTDDLEYFVSKIFEKPIFIAQYNSMSLGEKYQFLTAELLKFKKSLPETEHWEHPYFSRFLYDNYSPPLKAHTNVTNEEKARLAKEKIEKQQPYRFLIELLNELRRKNKISAVEFREFLEMWEDNPQNRESLVERLKMLLTSN